MAGEDSVEAFLAREQEQLAGIEDEFGGISVRQEGVVNGFSDFETPAVNGGEVGEELSNGGPTSNETTPTTLSALPPQQQAAMRQAATPTPPPSFHREEPAKIKIWREQQKERLEKKDAQEEKEKQKWREQAKRELEEWYKSHTDHVEKATKNNRVTEQDFIRERDADQPGQEWERITRLCEFNPKSAKNTKDVARFRSLLLQLKSQPLAANK